jgi:uncharacterized protein HemY
MKDFRIYMYSMSIIILVIMLISEAVVMTLVLVLDRVSTTLNENKSCTNLV